MQIYNLSNLIIAETTLVVFTLFQQMKGLCAIFQKFLKRASLININTEVY